MAYAIKDWKKFQHFKDRTPPWVKLYRDILDDPDWHSLSPEAAKTLVMLWVIASEDETKQGLLPESKKLAFRLRISEKSLQSIMSQLFHWLIQVDNGAISDRYQHDAPERAPEETETETETETSRAGSRFDQFWKAYPRKQGKGAAEKAFAKAKLSGRFDSMLIALERQKQSDQWQKEGGQYIPNPATWLNQKRWEDDPAQVNSSLEDMFGVIE